MTVQVLLHVRKYHPITYNAILLNIIHNIFKGKYKTLNKTLKICVHSCPRFVLVMIFCTISADKYGWIINASNIIHTYWICMYDYAKLKLLPSGISDLSRFSLSCEFLHIKNVFVFEYTWSRYFQKCVVRTKLDIHVFIYIARKQFFNEYCISYITD